MDHPNMNTDGINCHSPAILPLTMFSSSLTAGHEEASTSTAFVKQPAARKKRTKFLHINSQAGGGISKPTRKPDPAAPKITRPCTECGKKFWSWKALFGHMRCHPERQWRGINPPPNLQRRRPNSEDSSAVTEEDHEVADCLLLLASGATCCDHIDQDSPSTARTPQEFCNCDYNRYYNLAMVGFDVDNNNTDGNAANCREFECSSCKKVFGSHQALGGHRASHKNVKGCYAITKNIDEQEYCSTGGDNATASITNIVNDNNEILVTPAAGGHQCSICMRVFSSGQALGGHKRCHWEKISIEQGEDQEGEICAADGFDLNFPAALDKDDQAASSYSSIDSSFRNPNNLDLSLRL